MARFTKGAARALRRPPPIRDARVRAVFDAYPASLRRSLLALRGMIFETAAQLPEVLELTETLKWGQPAYLPTKTGVGTTVRIDALRPPRSGVALYVHCQTSIARQIRDRYPGLFDVEGDRALLFAADAELPRQELRHCIGLALTYHATRTTRPSGARRA